MEMQAGVELGLKYGMGFFETLKVIDGKPQFLPAHISRLIAGVDYAGIDAPHLYEHILEEISALPIQGNNIVSITVSANTRGYNIMVSSGYRKPSENWDDGIQVTLEPNVIRDLYNPLTRLKSCNYLLNYLKRNEAKAKGFGEVLFLNQEGGITEGTVTNFFFIQGDTILTAPPSEGLLPGVFRGALIEALRQEGYEVIERRILFHDEIDDMDGAFVTNSIIPIAPVLGIDNRTFGIPPLYRQILHVAHKLDSTILLPDTPLTD